MLKYYIIVQVTRYMILKLCAFRKYPKFNLSRDFFLWNHQQDFFLISNLIKNEIAIDFYFI